MTVYVDDMRASFRRMTMCHMIADTEDELDGMAAALGLKLAWKQKVGTIHEHYDISLTKRALAIKHGAVEINSSELGRILRFKRALT